MDRGHSTHQPMPVGTEEYMGTANGTGKSSKEDQNEKNDEDEEKNKGFFLKLFYDL